MSSTSSGALKVAPYYEDDACRIFNADCRDLLWSALKPDAIITDPPYGVDLAYGDAYSDVREGYEDFVGWFIDKARETAPIVALTPGIRNVSLYPKPDWMMCWAKTNSMRRNDTGGFNMWEPILLYGKRRIWQDLFAIPTVVKKDVGNHPCPKPTELFRWLIRILTDEGQTVLDPFMGSGTTLRAAKDLGRESVGIEIQKDYCDIAVGRLGQEVLAV